MEDNSVIVRQKNSGQVTVAAMVTASLLLLTGCSQNKTATSVPASPPAAAAQAAPPQPTTSSINHNHSILQAQSEYWRKHGQGTNEKPAHNPKN
jgi:uncharacterized lipoprotein YajG